MANSVNPVNPEPLAKLNKTFTPGTSGAQKTLKNLDSGFRRNDVEGLLQEALLLILSNNAFRSLYLCGERFPSRSPLPLYSVLSPAFRFSLHSSLFTLPC
jgi:hypothetical protein